MSDLGENRLLEVSGPLGTTRIEIANGEASIIASPCARKVCLGFGSIRFDGEMAVCLPNRVAIRIRGLTPAPVDAISR